MKSYNIKNKIHLPRKEGDGIKIANCSNKSVNGVIKEPRHHKVNSDFKSINNYGKPYDIGRLLFTRIQKW